MATKLEVKPGTTIVKPSSYELERWMKVNMPPTSGHDDNTNTLFFFSGIAVFDSPKIAGKGGGDSSAQDEWDAYEVTDMRVGPHWTAVEQVCPMVVAAAHDQDNPDEADGMGYQILKMEAPELVERNGVKRIELSLQLVVRGGREGSIPRLAYTVSVLGTLAQDPGNEGVFFGSRN